MESQFREIAVAYLMDYHSGIMAPISIDQLAVLNENTFQRAFAACAAEINPPALFAGLVLDGKLASVFSHGRHTSLETPAEQVAFRIASMTKCFASAAVLKLRDQGALRLDDVVTKILPQLPPEPWSAITIRHLLTMEGGLPTDDPWGDRLLGWSNQNFEQLLTTAPTVVAPPGAEYHYSNLGYMVLGNIIAEISGKSALAYIKDEFLVPLRMTNTDWNPAHTHWVAGYTRRNRQFHQEPVVITEYNGAVFAGIWSTVEDLTRWMCFLMDIPGDSEQALFENILSKTSRLELQEPVVQVPSGPKTTDRVSYGFGLRTITLNNFAICGHSGGLPGYGSHFSWCSKLRCGVVALCNVTYAPVTEPCRLLLKGVIDTIAARNRPVPEIITRRAGELLNYLRGDSTEHNQGEVFSSNFFLDNPPAVFESLRQQAAARLDELCPESGDIAVIMDRGLKARVIVCGEEFLSLMLAPAEDTSIQQVEFPWIKAE